MERRKFGKTDMEISILGFGGAEIGFHQTSQATVAELLDRALDAGLNVIDTAECYVNSEELIGEAVASRRKDYYLFTKCGHPQGFGQPDDWTMAGVTNCIEQSLKRLQTDYLDLVQLHSCTAEVLRQGEAIEALQRAREAGKTRYIGYSGDSTDAVCAIESGAFDTLQTSVSIADQESLTLLLPLAIQNNMGVIAKRPIANAAWRYQEAPEVAYHLPYWQRLKQLNYDFVADGGQAADTALRFTLYTAGVHTAIVGTTRPDRWQHNADVLAQGALPAEVYASIRKRWYAVADTNWVGQVEQQTWGNRCAYLKPVIKVEIVVV